MGSLRRYRRLSSYVLDLRSRILRRQVSGISQGILVDDSVHYMLCTPNNQMRGDDGEKYVEVTPMGATTLTALGAAAL